MQASEDGRSKYEPVKTWPLAVQKGDSLIYKWPLDHFRNGGYHLRIYGPNGFYRELMGDAADPDMHILCGYPKKFGLIKNPSGNIEITFSNASSDHDLNVRVSDHAYGNAEQTLQISKGTTKNLMVNTQESYGWYDFSVLIDGTENFERRFAGRVETGNPSKSDP